MPGMTPVVRRLVIANAAIWLACYLSTFVSNGFLIGLLRVFAVSTETWREWFPFPPLWQLVTYGFLHADLFHVLFNLLGLYFFGTMLEEIVGSRRFLFAYLVAVVAGGFASLAVGLVVGTDSITLGASGGVMATVVAAAVLRPDTRVIFLIFPMTLKVMAMIFVGMDVFRALESLRGAQSNVAWTAHLAGAACGFLAVRKGWIWRDPLERVEHWQRGRDQERRRKDAERLDRLLDKISREGIQALSPGEKAFLKRSSKGK